MVRIPAFDPIDYLLKRRFPRLKTPVPRGSIRAPTTSKPINLEKVKIYREQLLGMSKSELNAAVAREKEAERVEAAERAEREEQARFYHRPESVADFDYWSRASYWTIDEAVALSLGKNPRLVSWEGVGPFVRISKFAAEFEARRMLAQRARSMGQLMDFNIPGFLLAWAARTGFDFPDALVQAVQARGQQIADWKTRYDEAMALIEALALERDDLKSRPEQIHSDSSTARAEMPLLTRERETLLKLIIGMAIGGYGYVPSATRSRTAREIAEDLAKNGLSIDEDTVRKWLRAAKEILPGVGPDDGPA